MGFVHVKALPFFFYKESIKNIKNRLSTADRFFPQFNSTAYRTRLQWLRLAYGSIYQLTNSSEG